MNNISIDQLEAKIEAGEEISDTYFDPNTTRIGQKYKVIERREITTPEKLELPQSMLEEINLIANELNISSDSVIKMMLRRSLDEHYLAKRKFSSR